MKLTDGLQAVSMKDHEAPGFCIAVCGCPIGQFKYASDLLIRDEFTIHTFRLRGAPAKDILFYRFKRHSGRFLFKIIK